MFSETVLLRLVASIYDAAGDPQLWSVFLEQLAETVGGAATLMFLYDVKGHDGNIAATVRLDPEDLRKYSEHYIQVDQWGIQGAHLIKSGNVVTGQMLCPDQVLGRSASSATTSSVRWMRSTSFAGSFAKNSRWPLSFPVCGRSGTGRSEKKSFACCERSCRICSGLSSFTSASWRCRETPM